MEFPKFNLGYNILEQNLKENRIPFLPMVIPGFGVALISQRFMPSHVTSLCNALFVVNVLESPNDSRLCTMIVIDFLR